LKRYKGRKNFSNSAIWRNFSFVVGYR